MFDVQDEAFLYYVVIEDRALSDKRINDGYDLYPTNDFYLDWYSMEQGSVYNNTYFAMVF